MRQHVPSQPGTATIYSILTKSGVLQMPCRSIWSKLGTNCLEDFSLQVLMRLSNRQKRRRRFSSSYLLVH